MAIKAKPLKKLSIKEKPFLDNKNGEDFACPFVLFEAGEVIAADYARAVAGFRTPPTFVAKMKNNPPAVFILSFEYYKTASPELWSMIGDGRDYLNSTVIAKAITAVEALRPKIWPHTKDPSTVGAYQPQDNGVGKYIVQKMYPLTPPEPAYFVEETDEMFTWSPEKEKAQVFTNYEDAFVFAKRTEASHAERIRMGKDAANNVSILKVE